MFVMQKQNVEKAKQTLLNSSLDGTASNVDNKQSDHLLMVVAYNKWARILHEVRVILSIFIETLEQFFSADRSYVRFY